MKKRKFLRKKSFKMQKGITLIALVITIIILLILAGVSLSLVTGTNGILGKAKTSVNTTKEASAKEQVELKIAEFQTEYYEKVYVNHEENVNKKMGEWIAEKYSGPITTEDYTFEIKPDPDGDQYNVTIQKGKTLKQEIVGTLSEDGKLNLPPYTEYKFGEKVTLNGESFYVIEESDKDTEKVKLLAEKVIDTTTNTQVGNSGANTMAFSNSNTWAANDDLNNVGNSAVSCAINYGKKFDAKGRLMTKNELDKIVEYADGNQIIQKPEWMKVTGSSQLRYWLGTAKNTNEVWGVYYGNVVGIKYDDAINCYVRPVIEISKSKI